MTFEALRFTSNFCLIFYTIFLLCHWDTDFGIELIVNASQLILIEIYVDISTLICRIRGNIISRQRRFACIVINLAQFYNELNKQRLKFSCKY